MLQLVSASAHQCQQGLALQNMCMMVKACFKTKKETKFFIIWTVTFFKQRKIFSLLECANKISSWFLFFLETPKYTRLFSIAFCDVCDSGWAEIPQIARETSCVFILNCIFSFTVTLDGALGPLSHGQNTLRFAGWCGCLSRAGRTVLASMSFV